MSEGTSTCDYAAIQRIIETPEFPTVAIPTLFKSRCSFDEIIPLVGYYDSTASLFTLPGGRRVIRIMVYVDIEEPERPAPEPEPELPIPDPFVGLDDEFLFSAQERT